MTKQNDKCKNCKNETFTTKTYLAMVTIAYCTKCNKKRLL
jgi:hypothetical protein